MPEANTARKTIAFTRSGGVVCIIHNTRVSTALSLSLVGSWSARRGNPRSAHPRRRFDSHWGCVRAAHQKGSWCRHALLQEKKGHRLPSSFWRVNTEISPGVAPPTASTARMFLRLLRVPTTAFSFQILGQSERPWRRAVRRIHECQRSS